ncbi:alpha/beta fold hydrolase [Mucilaginibacter aquatilis]|uniref:Alpha/beta fold hydrolase n=1 Tax=Mucilaginibacter aquatilis TaxID=1517760 RepID=A0A6I4I7T0_9SPHI|nr:alpha/beta hydrolase [Mucilaginibacter aquatilis]MVN91285.1 alpha/beta fold hydrolase [Mucilaginibacter aquatilis]
MNTKFNSTELVQQWPGFESHIIHVNGVDLHYVDNGIDKPVIVCMPGWPQTWYSYKNLALPLSGSYRVIVVDIRGMGGSAMPTNGYDKKTMATDIYHLIITLKLQNVTVMGHDIGGMVAMSLAYNYPQVVQKLIVADGLHPNEGIFQMPLIPAPGTFTEKIDNQQPYTWWMSFNQVKDLPEKLLEGRFRFLLDWLFSYVMLDESKIPAFERDIYANVYNQPERIRASNAWYQTFGTDIADAKSYTKLSMPVLGIASNVSYGYYKYALPSCASNFELIHLPNTGHYMFEENPEEVCKAIEIFMQ